MTSTAISQKRREEILDTYLALMNEAKHRISWAAGIMQGTVPLPGTIARECVFLQLRMLCEVIALACLAAHGDIPASGTIRRQWRAGKMVDALDDLNPDFYPCPVTISPAPADPASPLLTPRETGFLTKKGLKRLNGMCGDVVHRGHLEKLLASPKRPKVSFGDASDWLEQIVTLLDTHVIRLIGGGYQIGCYLNPQPRGNVQVFFSERS